MRALGLRDGIAFPQVIVGDDGVARLIEVAARIPGGQMADLARHGVGVDLVEVALRQALGDPVPDELAAGRDPRSRSRSVPHRGARAAADRDGCRACRGLETVLAFPGVVPGGRCSSSRARRSGRFGSTATAAAT